MRRDDGLIATLWAAESYRVGTLHLIIKAWSETARGYVIEFSTATTTDGQSPFAGLEPSRLEDLHVLLPSR